MQIRHKILISLTYQDFCYAAQNDNDDPQYRDEIVYIFHKKVKLYKRHSSDEEEIHMYIKTNLLDNECIVISFHEEEYKLYPKWGTREE